MILIVCLSLLLHIYLFSCFFFYHTIGVHSVSRPSCLHQRRCDWHFMCMSLSSHSDGIFYQFICIYGIIRLQTLFTSDYLAVLRDSSNFCIALVGTQFNDLHWWGHSFTACPGQGVVLRHALVGTQFYGMPW